MPIENALWLLRTGANHSHDGFYHTREVIIYITLALLFQPFFKIALGRELWNVVDVIVAIWFLISILVKSKRYDNKPDIEVSNSKKDKTQTNKE